jgi:hypothetical protein
MEGDIHRSLPTDWSEYVPVRDKSRRLVVVGQWYGNSSTTTKASVVNTAWGDMHIVRRQTMLACVSVT